MFVVVYCYQVSHVSIVADFPNGKKDMHSVPDEWAVMQVRDSGCLPTVDSKWCILDRRLSPPLV